MQELKDLLANSPALFADIIKVLGALTDQMTGQNIPGVKPMPSGVQVDLTATDGTGTGYKLMPSGITDEELEAIRQGIADGIVSDKAVEWLKGLITGIALA